MNNVEEHEEYQGLHLSTLTLQSFRNYNYLQLDSLGSLNIFIGPNAIGKTSIIEAIQLLTALKSFRTIKVDQLVQWGRNEASLQAEFISPTRHLTTKLSLQNNKRSYSLNGKNKRIQDLKGLLPAVTFCPDDLYLIKGSNTTRLQSLDDLGTQLSKNFYTVKKDYVKLIRQKNQALKDERSDLVLDSLDDLLIKVGTQYLIHRLHVVDLLLDKLQYFYTQISGKEEQSSLTYIYSWDKSKERELLIHPHQNAVFNLDKHQITQHLQEALQQNRPQERIRQRSLIGPHADHFYFLLNNKNATQFASQGQQRTLVLSYKLAESNLIQDILQQKPLLLLDDVMSELDEERRNKFLDFITDDIQTFITTTNSGYFTDDLLSKAQVFELPFQGV